MTSGLDLRPVPAEQRSASLVDVALLFAGANVVTTTLVTGGALGVAFEWPTILSALAAGLLVGTLPIAVLSRLGPRYGVPSMVLLRSVFGTRGAAGVSLLLVLTNFAWIALNNVLAASALSRFLGGNPTLWSLGVGLIAIAVAAMGPRSMALFDRIAVPLMALIGALLTLELLRLDPTPSSAGASVVGSGGFFSALDIVAGYQVSWALMFADYTRFQRSERSASWAVLLGLAVTSTWLMMIGARAARIGGGSDPTDMVLALGLPAFALLIVALSTVTTNFVNLFVSGLALRNLWPGAPERGSILAVGAIGTTLGMISTRLLDSYASYMEFLGTCFLPLVAITLVHFFGVDLEAKSELRAPPRLRWRAVGAWVIGVMTYQTIQQMAGDFGATLPTLVVSAACYWLLSKTSGSEPSGSSPSAPG